MPGRTVTGSPPGSGTRRASGCGSTPPAACKVYVVRSRGRAGARGAPGRHGKLAAGRAELHAAGFACHDEDMDTDLITVALGLAALIIGLFAWVRADASAGRRELLQKIDSLRDEMRQEIGGLRGEIGQEIGGLRGEMRQEIGGLRGEIGQEIGGLRGEMRQEIGGLRGEIGQEIGGLRDEMRQAIAEHRAETAAAFERLDDRLRAVEHGQAKLEGLLEGLREAVAGRAAA